MKAFLDLVLQWIRPILKGVNVKLLVKALKLAYEYIAEAERQRTEGDGQFSKTEKAEWVKQQIREQTALPDRWIDFIFGIAIARFITEKNAASNE